MDKSLKCLFSKCLASWFSLQEISWKFGSSSKILAIRFSARFFKIMDRNPRKFLDFLARKQDIQDLTKRTKKNLGFLAQKNFGVVRFLTQILAIIPGKVGRIFQDRRKKSNKFLEVISKKPKISKILRRETRKSCIIDVIQDLETSYKQLSLKFQKGGYS